MNRRLPIAALLLSFALAPLAIAEVEYQRRDVPAGTEIAADFNTERNEGPEALLDGDPKTFMRPGGNTASRPVTLTLRFPQPLMDVAGVGTGDAEPFHNYYPKEMRFYGDTDGDGHAETYLGMTTNLGPAKESRGDHLFGRKPAQLHGLDVVAVKQNQAGAMRAFSMNELQLLHTSAAFGDDALVEPGGGPKRGGLPTVDPNVPTPDVLIDMEQKPRLRVNRDKANKHHGRYVQDDGKSVHEFTWQEGSTEPFMEVLVLASPKLHGFGGGAVLSVPVNADKFPGYQSIGARVKDANGEIFRWSADLDPQKPGWQHVRIALDPALQRGSWGGTDTGRGEIDPPVQLVALTFTAPKEFQSPASIRVGTVHRNEVRPEDVSDTERMNGVNVALAGPRKAAVIARGEESALGIALENTGAFETTLTLQGALRSYHGTELAWKHETPVTLKPGEKATVPFDPKLERMGWYSFDLSMTSGNGEATISPHQGWLAYIDPVGQRPRTPDDFQFGIGGMGFSDDAAEAAVLIGSDWTRGGLNWNEAEKEQGKFDWRKLDEQVARAEKFGYAYQHLLSYGNTWAVRPGYVEKYKPKEGWWVNTLAPQPEPWRNFVRTAAERYKGRVAFWEIWNEPDLAGYFKGTTDDYLELLEIAYTEIKSVDPSYEVWTAGFATVNEHGGHALNPDMQRRTIAEGHEHFDVLAHHEHGTFAGFQRALDGPLASMMEALSSPKPIAFNETAIDAKRGLEFQAQTLVKKITYAKARGGKYYSWFHIHRPNDHEGFGMLDNSFHPRPIYPAFNEVVRQLRGKPFLRDVDLGKGRQAHLFGDGSDQVLVAWREASDVSDVLASVRPGAGATVERIDLMGNRAPIDIVGGVAAFAVVEEPAYIAIRGAGSEAVRAGVLASPIAEVPDDRAGVLRLLPGFDEADAAAMAFRIGDARSTGESMEIAQREQGPDAKPWVEAFVSLSGVEHALRVPIRRTINIPAGDVDSRDADFTLDEPGDIVSFFGNDPGNAHRDWQGPDDLSGKVWLGVDGASLRIRVDVKDDRLHQPHTGGDIWKADSLQIGIQPPGETGFIEIGVAPDTAATGAAQLALLGRLGSADPIKGATATAKTTGAGVVYDVTLPLDGLKLEPAALRDGFRFNLIINDNDNHGSRDALAQIAPGIGQFKDGQLFPIVRFVKRE